MREIRFAIMGAGHIARKFTGAAKQVEGVRVIAASSKDMKRAKAFAEAFDIEHYGTYEEILKMPDVDAVYIATTQNFHKENVRMCLESGKHVICEKAMFLTVQDAEEMFALAREKKLFVMEAMWTRFLPNIQKAKQWILNGRIGKIQSAAASIGFYCYMGPEHRLINPDLGGGAMYDIGVYAIEVVSYLVGQRIMNASGLVRKHPVTGVDERVSMLIDFEDVDAVLQCSFAANVPQYIYISGSDGYIEIPTFHVGNESRLYDGNRELTERFIKEFPEGNGFVYEIQAAAQCIRDGRRESDIIPWADTLECCRVFDAVLKNSGK